MMASAFSFHDQRGEIADGRPDARDNDRTVTVPIQIQRLVIEQGATDKLVRIQDTFAAFSRSTSTIHFFSHS
jgi:stress response protein YsnF